MLERMKPTTRRNIESAMGHPLVNPGATDESRKDIPGGASRRLIFDLPTGLFKAGKLLPLHMLQMLTVELTIGYRGQAFNDGTNKSTNWDISDVSLIATCLHVNSTVSAQYHQHLEEGNDMPIVHQAVVGAKFLVSNNSFTWSISRSLTRLKQL